MITEPPLVVVEVTRPGAGSAGIVASCHTDLGSSLALVVLATSAIRHSSHAPLAALPTRAGGPQSPRSMRGPG